MIDISIDYAILEKGDDVAGILRGQRCVFCRGCANGFGVWWLSDEQARREHRPAGAITVYGLCGSCATDFDSSRAEEAECAITAIKVAARGRVQ
jgi:hypothetical protein